MARKAKQDSKAVTEEIDVSDFRDISIRFPADVYILAMWLALADRAKSTPTSKRHTTLHGLAAKFASLYGADYSDSLSSEYVMEVFRMHGISGNPLLSLPETSDNSIPTLTLPNSPEVRAEPIARIAEQTIGHESLDRPF